ncbi:hypothetical protein JOB18_022249 [Solea senegalensis]|uniref:Uncharacterized protein n=1 Tax=Solea senegalensis TaxID=28829 RepID=A0AAV6T6I9_SOLSE|nr:hypothetical protein JOB18_022249 [Solea senegalensis]
MNPDRRAIYNCRPSSPQSQLPDFSVCRRDGRKAQGYLRSNHYTISSPRRPGCIHLSVSSPLSRPLSLCHFASLSLFIPLSFPCVYLSSNLCLLGLSLYSVPHADAM